MQIEYKGKWFPEVGTKVTIRHYYTDTAEPYTVDSIVSGKVVVRRCGMKFYGDRYFDTLPDEIYDDPEGEKKTLTWSPSRKNWILSSCSGDRYPGVADWNSWEYSPYLD